MRYRCRYRNHDAMLLTEWLAMAETDRLRAADGIRDMLAEGLRIEVERFGWTGEVSVTHHEIADVRADENGHQEYHFFATAELSTDAPAPCSTCHAAHIGEPRPPRGHLWWQEI